MSLFIRKTFPFKVEADITKKLSMYSKAGLSLSESLDILVGQTKTKRYIQTMKAWQMAIENGRTLAQAFEVSDMYRSPHVAVGGVTKLAVALGDKSGSLADSLLHASQYINRKIATRKKVINAVAYPTAILVGTLGLVVGLIVFIFPKIIPLFESLKVTLPLSTRMVIVISHAISAYWYIILASIFILVTSAILLVKRSSPFQSWAQYFLLRLPGVGRIIKLRQVSSIFDSLQTLIGGGEQLSEALKIISEISKFNEYRNFLFFAGEEVSQGRSLAEFIQKNKALFPVYVAGIVSAGERTANLQSAISDTAEIVQTDLDDLLKVFTATIEPVLMICMSLLIGFIAMSIILPIYGITSHFQG